MSDDEEYEFHKSDDMNDEPFTKEGEISRLAMPMTEGEELVTNIDGKEERTPEGRFKLKLLDLVKKLGEESIAKSLAQNVIEHISRIPHIVYKNPEALVITCFVNLQLKINKKPTDPDVCPPKILNQEMDKALSRFKFDISKFDIIRYMRLLSNKSS